MTKDDLLKTLIAIARKWEKEAWEQVPEEYSSRNLHYKFLKLDNEAAGLSTCADELKALIDEVRAECPKCGSELTAGICIGCSDPLV